MKILRHHKGQTLIETALILFVLMLIALGTVEFARAWFTKSSMKNAARQGARVAVVTPNTNITTSFTCDTSTVCPNSDAIINAVCCQPGVPKKDGGTSVTITCRDSGGAGIACNTITSGGEIEVVTTAWFDFIIGGSSAPWPWRDQNFTADAVMRYE